ncbi:hypothetical protein [Streptomyces lydicus]|uniref:hypothetical protein n=1 Tax=Streptomyces lydicus TaxID=47763 RepID=UPI00321FAE74
MRRLVYCIAAPSTTSSPTRTVRTPPARTASGRSPTTTSSIWLLGGSELAGVLYPEIDQLIVKLSPLTLGSALPLFSPTTPFRPHTWELTEHTLLQSGPAFLTYDRGGAV